MERKLLILLEGKVAEVAEMESSGPNRAHLFVGLRRNDIRDYGPQNVLGFTFQSYYRPAIVRPWD